jgi:hypothetical protein
MTEMLNFFIATSLPTPVTSTAPPKPGKTTAPDETTPVAPVTTLSPVVKGS